MKLHGTMEIKDGQLEIGHIAVKQLAKQFGTPLYIFDEAEFINQSQKFLNSFDPYWYGVVVPYFSKQVFSLWLLFNWLISAFVRSVKLNFSKIYWCKKFSIIG